MAKRAPPRTRTALLVVLAVLVLALLALLLRATRDAPLAAAARDGSVHVAGRLPCTQADDEGAEGAYQDVWDAGGELPGIPATPFTDLVVLSGSEEDAEDGRGARLAELRGLDASFAPTREVVRLRGSTPVRVARAFRVVHSVELSGFGEGSNVGDVEVRGDGALLALVRAGQRASHAARYVVPLAHSGSITRWGARVNRVARVGMPRSALFALRLNGTPLDVVGEWSGGGGGGGGKPAAFPVREGDVVSVSVQSGAHGMDVSAWFDLQLAPVH